MKIRTIVVDDEPLARARIVELLADEEDFQIIGECGSGAEAVDQITQHRPDLVFLDVQMPGASGFDILRELKLKRMPVIIFVTAYDQYALDAFEVHALDYLLKPFKPGRFKTAVQRARQQLRRDAGEAVSAEIRNLIEAQRPQAGSLARVMIKSPDRVFFLKIEEIDYIESAANYLVLYTGSENHVLRETLTHMESKLAREQFVRISRSVVVNVDAIKELQPIAPGEYVVILRNGKRLSMTRGIRELQEHLEQG